MKQSNLKSNFVFNLVYQVFVIITPIFTTPYISRVLSADGIGKYSYALSIVTYFGILGALGSATYGQLEIAKRRDDEEKLHVIISEIFWGRLITLLVSFGIYLIVIWKASIQYRTLYIVLSLYILGQMNDVSFILQGLEWFKTLAIRNIIIKILNIIMIFVCVKGHEDIYIYAIIIHGVTLIGNFSLWPQVFKYICPLSGKMHFLKHWKSSLIYFIPTVATMVYTVLDKSMIGWITGSEFQNGYYEQAYKIEQMLLVFVTTVGTVTLPRMAYLSENENNLQRKHIIEMTMKLVVLISFPLCFGTIAVAENLIPVFLGKGYEECVELLKIFSFLIIIIGLDNTIGKQCLISTGKQKEYNRGVIIGAIINFIINIIMIPKFGAYGAAIASVIAEGSILIIFISHSWEDLIINEFKKCILKYFIITSIMAISVYKVGLVIENKMLALCIQILVGVIIYGILLLICKDEFVIQIFRKLKHKK